MEYFWFRNSYRDGLIEVDHRETDANGETLFYGKGLVSSTLGWVKGDGWLREQDIVGDASEADWLVFDVMAK